MEVNNKNLGFGARFGAFRPNPEQEQRLFRVCNRVAKRFPGSEVDYKYITPEKNGLPKDATVIAMYLKGANERAEKAFDRIAKAAHNTFGGIFLSSRKDNRPDWFDELA